MNKVLAILGLIALIAVGGLFFFAGFFTGSTVHLTPAEQKKIVENVDKLSMSDVEKTINSESTSLSEKIRKILGATTDEPTKTRKKNDQESMLEESQISINSLLKEIAASHTINDDCSIDKTQESLKVTKRPAPDTLEGKRIVFVGYFKTNIALQIQKLLLQKGYKVHVEESRTSNHESFVFCGPFRDRKNAELLVTWLNKHEFADARVVKVERDTLEETLYDASANDSDMPTNAERNIPEASENEIMQLQQQLIQQQRLLERRQDQQEKLIQQQQALMQQQGVQQQADEQSQQTDEQPQQTDEQPQQTDEQPQQTDEQSQQTDEQSQQTDEQPQQTDEQSQQTDEQPQQTDEQPQQTDEQPQQTDE